MKSKLNINLNNYELYFLDYYEGSLSPALVEELFEFISAHPELKEEFENFEIITLDNGPDILFEEKQSLKKQSLLINSNNFDEYAIGYVEGTLSAGMQKELERFIRQNPMYRKELDLYLQTKLTPDKSIVFNDKYSLKRRTRQPAALYYWSAAASVAVIMGLYFVLNKNETPKGGDIVKHTQSMDTNIMGSHNRMPAYVDSNPSNKNLNSPPLNNQSQRKITIVKAQVKNQDKEKGLTKAKLDSGSNGKNAMNKEGNAQILSAKEMNNIPYNNENASFVLAENLRDTILIENWKRKYDSLTTRNPVVAVADVQEERTESTLFYLIGKVTCKGLHKITGQRIQLKKRYNSDTTNVIAYQLNLGKARIQFPVKE